jgi:hypothetical protein
MQLPETSPADLQDREQHGCGGAGAEEQALQPVNEEEGGAYASGATTGMRSPARVCSQHFVDAGCRRYPLQSPLDWRRCVCRCSTCRRLSRHRSSMPRSSISSPSSSSRRRRSSNRRHSSSNSRSRRSSLPPQALRLLPMAPRYTQFSPRLQMMYTVSPHTAPHMSAIPSLPHQQL